MGKPSNSNSRALHTSKAISPKPDLTVINFHIKVNNLDVEVPQAELVDIDRLQLDGDNPNKMKLKQLQALSKAIKKWGFIVPLITNRDLLVADGELRLIVA